MFFPLIIRQISQIMGPGKKGETRLWKDFKVSFKNREQQRIWKIR
jgi:hypothetical protein